MSALLLSALAAGSSGQGALYVDDVFSTYLYTGNGSTQTINNGIDLAGKGGMIWSKMRMSDPYSNGWDSHWITDTAIGTTNFLRSNLTNGSFPGGVITPTSTGYSLNGQLPANIIGNLGYVSWTFRKAPKFFDVVTFTATGASGVNIPHSLGVEPGCIFLKPINATDDWLVYHRSIGLGKALKLNTTDATLTQANYWVSVSSSSFCSDFANTAAGLTYVAYLFAHDPSADGIIQCGSFTTDASGNATVNLGWEPQYLMIKSSSNSGNWVALDVMRGLNKGNSRVLYPNLSVEEGAGTYYNVESTGFTIIGAESNRTFIYLAIRRPNKPPTSGTQVYNASTASGVVSAGFPVDLHIGATRAGAASNHAMHARLTGGTKELVTSSTAAEATITDLGFDSMTGLRASLPAGGVNHFFRRAPGFFDVVCYTGTTPDVQAVKHNLGVVPELIIVKNRLSAYDWPVYSQSLSLTYTLTLNSTAYAVERLTAFNSARPTATEFYVGGNNVATNYQNCIAYLFASLPGISKVGSYTGNGSSQTIDCGFSAGARFVLIKRTDATGDWYVWDSVRGIIAANDPHLSLNTTAAEVTTDDSVDPDASGFIVNQNTATNINVNGGSYIFLAIA